MDAVTESSGMMTIKLSYCDEYKTVGLACDESIVQGHLVLTGGTGSKGSIVYKHYSNGVFQGTYSYALKNIGLASGYPDLTALAGITAAAGDQYEVSVSGSISGVLYLFCNAGALGAAGPLNANFGFHCYGNGHAATVLGSSETCICE